MQNVYARIDDALIMAGLPASQITQIKAGAEIYGDNGLIDSLGLVRLISAVSTGFEDMGVDMFDMMAELDVEAVEAFANRESIYAFLARILPAQLQEAV